MTISAGTWVGDLNPRVVPNPPTSTTPGVLRPVQSLNVTEHKVADLADLLIPYAERLETSEIPNAEIPTNEEIVEWTRGLFTDQGGRLRVRKSPAKGASNVVRAVHGLYRWHASGGHLDGLMIARWNAGDAWPRVETYITILQVASGRTSQALEAWKRTGLIR